MKPGLFFERLFRRGLRPGRHRHFSDRELWRLFLPLAAEQGFCFLVGMASTIMVSSVGEDAVSGVSLVEFVMAFFLAVFWAAAAGGTVVSGQYLGRRNTPMARVAADQLVRVLFAFGILVTAAVAFGTDLILDGVFGSISAGVRANASGYLAIALFSIPAAALNGACAAVFRTVGNSRLPMFVSLLVGGLHAAGSAAAVYGFGLGTEGVAISETAARWVGSLLLLWLCMHEHFPLRLYRKLFVALRWDLIRAMVGVGLPYGFESGLFQLGRLAVLGLVATYGTTAIAANAVSGNLCLINVLPGMAVFLGMTTVIARCAGAGDWDEARYYTRKILFGVHAGHLVSGGLLMLAMPPVLDLYHLTPATADLVWQIVAWHVLFSLLTWPVSFVMPSTLRAGGDARYPMAAGIASMIFVRILLAWVFGTVCGMGVLGTWFGMYADWAVRTLVFWRRYRSGAWTRFRVI